MAVAIAAIETSEDLELANKHLISDELWERVVNRIIKDEEMPRELAERIMDQTLAFLMLSSLEQKGQYSPSALVDIGWHTFLLYTRAYAAFCQKLAGRFIHHEPTDESGVEYPQAGPYRTIEALKHHGITVDEPLWACGCETDSSNCNGGQGCQCGGCNY